MLSNTSVRKSFDASLSTGWCKDSPFAGSGAVHVVDELVGGGGATAVGVCTSPAIAEMLMTKLRIAEAQKSFRVILNLQMLRIVVTVKYGLNRSVWGT